jgi:amino acid transporter
MEAQVMLMNAIAIVGEVIICYIAGLFYYMGSRNIKYLKWVLPRKKQLATLLLYSHYVYRALLCVVSFIIMTIVLFVGIYGHDRFITIDGIGSVVLMLVYLLFFAVGYSDARRVFKSFF